MAWDRGAGGPEHPAGAPGERAQIVARAPQRFACNIVLIVFRFSLSVVSISA
jgi:hypothetical protein